MSLKSVCGAAVVATLVLFVSSSCWAMPPAAGQIESLCENLHQPQAARLEMPTFDFEDFRHMRGTEAGCLPKLTNGVKLLAFGRAQFIDLDVGRAS
ncbi:hypothetical protein [Xylophilus sp. GOD-11R]|uniref:hypothetical protein n=1 Tax=Xylophilus sp. GOD-11R TaxID=3089814 RepID=UPI00298D2D51|nr:hypothetical protein [Xylophilus sp. GOD-11R]WPB57372.1 hypothetical protein R9X41_01585 [Xylophilus sp. GOD-11R]